MGFLEELKANNIDPDRYIALQNQFIMHCRQALELKKGSMSYREYLEQDQFLTKIEKFISQIERERIQQKIGEMSNPSSF